MSVVLTASGMCSYLIPLRLARILSGVDSHLKCKAGFCEGFEWGEIVESLSWSIVDSIRLACIFSASRSIIDEQKNISPISIGE